MERQYKSLTQNLLNEAQRRVPAGQRLIQEAFTSDHNHRVLIKLRELAADTFYVFDQITARAFCDAVIDLAAKRGHGRLTVGYPDLGEFEAQRNRLDHLTAKFDTVRVFAEGRPRRAAKGFQFVALRAARPWGYRLALHEGTPPMLAICHEKPAKNRNLNTTGLGFFTFDPLAVAEIADDLEDLTHSPGKRINTFDKLAKLHETTQRVARELENYSRRVEQAVQQARRRPDLLTPQRFNRIVSHAVAKMEQLKQIPLHALADIGSSRKR